jgi:hypothetical protein
MPTVNNVYTTQINNTDLINRSGAKSPTSITTFVNKVSGGSETGAPLGDYDNYANLPFYAGIIPKVSLTHYKPTDRGQALIGDASKTVSVTYYQSNFRKPFRQKKKVTTKATLLIKPPNTELFYLDFNGDPNGTNRQTAMHAVNAILNPTANDHGKAYGGPTPNVRNLFWGSQYANGQHKSIAENPSKNALTEVQKNNNGLFGELRVGNYPITHDATNKIIEIGDNTTPQLKHCTKPAGGTNQISEDDWIRYTGFALEYTTQATYYPKSDLKTHFLASIDRSQLAKLFADESEAEQIKKMQTFMGNSIALDDMLQAMDGPKLKILFEKESVAANLDISDFTPVLDGLSDLERETIHTKLGGTVASGAKVSGAQLVTDHAIKDIAAEIYGDVAMKANFLTVLDSNYDELALKTMLSKVKVSIKDDIAEVHIKKSQGANYKATAINLVKLLNKEQLEAVQNQYESYAENAATALEGIAVNTFQSLGQVHVPDFTGANNTFFDQLNAVPQAQWANNDLQKMTSAFIDAPPRVRISQHGPFSFSGVKY